MTGIVLGGVFLVTVGAIVLCLNIGLRYKSRRDRTDHWDEVLTAALVQRADFTEDGIASVVPGYRRLEEGEPYQVHIWVAWWHLAWPPWKRRVNAILAEITPVHVHIKLHWTLW